MPIYEYSCSGCGHNAEVMQKISDTQLTTCPACGQESFSKQLSAPGFQLKGSGWYATDFKGCASSDKKDSTPAETPCGGSCACH